MLLSSGSLQITPWGGASPHKSPPGRVQTSGSDPRQAKKYAKEGLDDTYATAMGTFGTVL